MCIYCIYLSGNCCTLQEVSWPEELCSHSCSGQTQGHTATGVKRAVQVLKVPENVLPDGIVE